jgi:hypothetical protein
MTLRVMHRRLARRPPVPAGRSRPSGAHRFRTLPAVSFQAWNLIPSFRGTDGAGWEPTPAP